MLKVLDLFSGIGGFSLGLERTGGFETVAFCEIEPYAQKVLKKHWPDVPIFEDVRTINAETLQEYGIVADVITGGFPCQDLSVVGRRAGIGGERSGLWTEIIRIAGEIRPRFIIVENVANLLAGPSEQPGGWFGRVLGDLAEIGFDAEWHCIRAARAGLPHVRDRVWIIAYPNSQRLQGRVQDGQIIRTEALSIYQVWDAIPANFISHGNDGLPRKVERNPGANKALGNAVVPQIPEMIGNAILAAEAA